MHRFFSKPETLQRLRRGPLGDHLDRYADWLSEPGFCRVHARLQLVQIADFSPIALWLGHESPATTHIYLDANLALKEQILDKIGTLDGTKTGRYRPEDPVLKFLKSL